MPATTMTTGKGWRRKASPHPDQPQNIIGQNFVHRGPTAFSKAMITASRLKMAADGAPNAGDANASWTGLGFW